MADPTVKELLFRLDDQNRADHGQIAEALGHLKEEFTIFKWKTIGIATGSSVVLSVIVTTVLKVVF